MARSSRSRTYVDSDKPGPLYEFTGKFKPECCHGTIFTSKVTFAVLQYCNTATLATRQRLNAHEF